MTVVRIDRDKETGIKVWKPFHHSTCKCELCGGWMPVQCQCINCQQDNEDTVDALRREITELEGIIQRQKYEIEDADKKTERQRESARHYAEEWGKAHRICDRIEGIKVDLRATLQLLEDYTEYKEIEE